MLRNAPVNLPGSFSHTCYGTLSILSLTSPRNSMIERPKSIFEPPKSISDFIRQILATLEYFPHIFIFFGLVILAFGAYRGFDFWTFVTSSREVNVTVVQVDRKNSNNGLVYRPVFEIVLPDGSNKRYAGNYWLNSSPHTEGDVIAGRYSDVDGTIASNTIIDIERDNIAIIMATGFLFSIFGGLSLWYRNRRRRKKLSA